MRLGDHICATEEGGKKGEERGRKAQGFLSTAHLESFHKAAGTPCVKATVPGGLVSPGRAVPSHPAVLSQ